jgi:hypothetical protein
MKTNLTFFSSSLAICVAMIACENKDQDPKPEPVDPKSAYNAMIKLYDNAAVLKWDEELSLTVDNKMPPPAESRIYAMVSLAIHDALNNVVPKYETYALDNSGVDAKDVSKQNIKKIADAAVAQAAHDALVVLAPGSAASADSLLTVCLAGIEESEFKARGIQTGKDAASAVLAERQNDPPLIFATYPQGTDPGQYRSTMPYAAASPPVWPENSAYASDMGAFRPFGIETSDQFRARPPYSLDSPEYAADYDEVKRFGSNTSTERTQEQADMGQFFLDNVSNSLNRVVRIMAVQEGLNGWETARLLALIQMTQFDAVLSSFEGKYHYNRWRPITAIRSADDDGNAETAGDPAWSILQAARATPPTPTYPSAHAETSGAGAEIFKLFFENDNKPFTTGSYSLPGAERSFASFSQFASECSESRIYIGYHFRDDIVQGESKGRELAKYVFANNLREL